MRPCKSLQHLIKWFGIFIRAKTKFRKRKERLNRGKRKNLPLAWGEAHLSSRPSPPGLPCRLPPRAAKQLGGAAPTPWTPPRRPGRSRPPQASKVRQGDARGSLSPFPPPPLRLAPPPRFSLFLRDQPPFVDARTRSQRRS